MVGDRVNHGTADNTESGTTISPTDENKFLELLLKANYYSFMEDVKSAHLGRCLMLL